MPIHFSIGFVTQRSPKVPREFVCVKMQTDEIVDLFIDVDGIVDVIYDFSEEIEVTWPEKDCECR